MENIKFEDDLIKGNAIDIREYLLKQALLLLGDCVEQTGEEDIKEVNSILEMVQKNVSMARTIGEMNKPDDFIEIKGN